MGKTGFLWPAGLAFFLGPRAGVVVIVLPAMEIQKDELCWELGSGNSGRVATDRSEDLRFA
jgi:hypothetical protein